MSIRKCDKLDNVRHDNLADIYAFIASGWELAEIELDGRKAWTVYRCFRDVIRRKGISGVKVMKRGERVFLRMVDE